MNSRRRGTEFGLILLASELMGYGVNRIPPVTLGTIVLNVVAYMYLPFRLQETCISVEYVWFQKDLKRLMIGAIDHLDDIHLYYNMVSLLWKGSSLERRLKSPYFAYLLVVFTAMTSVTLTAINALLAQVTQDQSYTYQCAAGFSGVLFALKVLTTHYEPPGTRHLLGVIPVPSKWVYWAELVLIQLIVPNASFTGHLAGILVGVAYIRGPLKTIMNAFVPAVPSYSYHSNETGYRHNRGSSGEYEAWYNSQPNPSAPQNPFSGRSYNNPSETRYRGPSPTAPPPPGWRDEGSRLYPDLGNVDSNQARPDLTDEEQLEMILERSRWDK